MSTETELYKKYRPKTLQAVIGQSTAVKALDKMLGSNFPHALLLTGPSGVGKTTLARILRVGLKCGERDFIERNCADFRSIDDVREIRRHCNMMPIEGRCRIWLIDECHKLTNDAQNALLKILEDTPKHVYFMLCTTEPHKVIKTIHTRCSQVKLAGISGEILKKLLQNVAAKEGMEIEDGIMNDIVTAAEGSARKALVILEQVGAHDNEKDQREAINATSFDKDLAFALAKELMIPAHDWTYIAKLLRSMEEQDVEGIRRCILGYARAFLIGSKDGKRAPNERFLQRAFDIIGSFRKHFFDGGHPELAASCLEAYHQDNQKKGR